MIEHNFKVPLPFLQLFHRLAKGVSFQVGQMQNIGHSGLEGRFRSKGLLQPEQNGNTVPFRYRRPQSLDVGTFLLSRSSLPEKHGFLAGVVCQRTRQKADTVHFSQPGPLQPEADAGGALLGKGRFQGKPVVTYGHALPTDGLHVFLNVRGLSLAEGLTVQTPEEALKPLRLRQHRVGAARQQKQRGHQHRNGNSPSAAGHRLFCFFVKSLINGAQGHQQILSGHSAIPSCSRKRRSFSLVRCSCIFTLLSLAAYLWAISPTESP